MSRTIKGLQVIVISLSIILIIIRFFLEEPNILIFMAIVNAITLSLSIVIVLFTISIKLDSQHKYYLQQNLHMRIEHNSRIALYNLVILILLFALIPAVYYVVIHHRSNLTNDIVTIITLTLAISNDILTDFFSALLYKYE